MPFATTTVSPGRAFAKAVVNPVKVLTVVEPVVTGVYWLTVSVIEETFDAVFTP